MKRQMLTTKWTWMAIVAATAVGLNAQFARGQAPDSGKTPAPLDEERTDGVRSRLSSNPI